MGWVPVWFYFCRLSRHSTGATAWYVFPEAVTTNVTVCPARGGGSEKLKITSPSEGYPSRRKWSLGGAGGASFQRPHSRTASPVVLSEVPSVPRTYTVSVPLTPVVTLWTDIHIGGMDDVHGEAERPVGGAVRSGARPYS